MSRDLKVELTINTSKFIAAMYQFQEAINNMHIRLRGGHTDGAYAEVMLREHLHALARQGLDRKGRKHARD